MVLATQFSFLLIVAPLFLLALWLAKDGFSRTKPVQLFVSSSIFFILTAVLFFYGIPGQPTALIQTLNVNASQVTLSYSYLTVQNDPLIQGLGYSFLAITVLMFLFTLYVLIKWLQNYMARGGIVG